MVPVTGSEAAVVAALASQVVAVLAQWVRSWWRVRREDAHRLHVEALAQLLPAGSLLEQATSDGSWLRLSSNPCQERTQDGIGVE